MKNRVIKVAASGIVLGATMVGCKPAGAYRPLSVSASVPRAQQDAVKRYQQARIDAQHGNLTAALTDMEDAVALSPQDVGYRLGLADLYMKNGRFASAETTFGDVLTLDPSNARAGISIALAQLGQGKVGAATAQLDAMEGRVSPADLGLAYALAGNTERAIALLEPLSRGIDGTARVRQNLALAYALAGNWGKAKVIAAQDVSPAELNVRLAQWAALADPSAANVRVAAVLGVKAARDAGQPSRLALAPAPTANEALAAAEPAPAVPAAAPVTAPAVPVAATAASAEIPARVDAEANAPVTAVAAAVPAEVPAETASAVPQAAPVIAPAVAAQYAAAAQSLVHAAAIEAQPGHRSPSHSAGASRYRLSASSVVPRRTTGGRFVVQLGAFTTPANAARAWTQAQRRFGAILAGDPLSTTIRLGDNRLLHRLSIAGFDNQNAAARVCLSIRARGGSCFVRGLAGDAPVQWASRTSRKA